MIQALEIY